MKKSGTGPKRESGESEVHEVEKIIALYLAYSNQPVPIDDILELTNPPPIQALNLMEGLKRCRLVIEKKRQTGPLLSFERISNLCHPLRERGNDIGTLAQHFFSMFKKKLNRTIGKIPREELNKLMSYHWPGNVRELKHFIERAVILSDGNSISLSGLEFEMSNINSNEISIFETSADVEREKIKKTLERTLLKIRGPNGAASFLGLHPSTLCHRMKKLGIKKPTIIQ